MHQQAREDGGANITVRASARWMWKLIVRRALEEEEELSALAAACRRWRSASFGPPAE